MVVSEVQPLNILAALSASLRLRLLMSMLANLEQPENIPSSVVALSVLRFFSPSMAVSLVQLLNQFFRLLGASLNDGSMMTFSRLLLTAFHPGVSPVFITLSADHTFFTVMLL